MATSDQLRLLKHYRDDVQKLADMMTEAYDAEEMTSDDFDKIKAKSEEVAKLWMYDRIDNLEVLVTDDDEEDEE